VGVKHVPPPPPPLVHNAAATTRCEGRSTWSAQPNYNAAQLHHRTHRTDVGLMLVCAAAAAVAALGLDDLDVPASTDRAVSWGLGARAERINVKLHIVNHPEWQLRGESCPHSLPKIGTDRDAHASSPREMPKFSSEPDLERVSE
jgi:hypothetical protein